MSDNSISERIRELIGDMSVSAFAQMCGIPTASMRQYLDKSIPGADKAAKIAIANGVNLQWLIIGTGAKYTKGLSEYKDKDPNMLVMDIETSRARYPNGNYLAQEDSGRKLANIIEEKRREREYDQSMIVLRQDLLGRIVDRIFRVYKDIGAELPAINLGEIAAEKYNEITRTSSDPDEWPALIDLMGIRLKKQIIAATPGSGKASESGQ